jgi:hypothetical protein
MIAQIHNYACGNVECSKKDWHRIQVQRYNPKLGAGYYVAKYITKTLRKSPNNADKGVLEQDFDMYER